MRQDQDAALRMAEEELTFWQREVQSQQEVVEKATIELGEAQKKALIASAFLNLLRERYGWQGKVEAGSRFGSMPLKDAALTIIKERGSIRPPDLIAILRAEGFRFGKQPGRQLHAAMIHQHRAVKDHAGFWRWTAIEQEALPLEGGGNR